MLESNTAIADWLRTVGQDSELQVERVAIADCRGWDLRDGVLAHESGRFFTLRGLQAFAGGADAATFCGPMIDQPEIGRLGFLTRPAGAGVEWLLQAKTEPGNAGSAAQIAPSIQATPSNFGRVHGGRSTAFLDLFLRPAASLSDGPFSEQGSCFLWKFNRNQLVVLPAGAAPEPVGDPRWRWSPSSALRMALGQSYTVNTDARSVIATAPWSLLAGGQPLFRSEVLQRSFSAPQRTRLAPRAGLLQDRTIIWRLGPLDEPPGRRLTAHALVDEMEREAVICCSVQVKGREVESWSQPFLTSAVVGRQVLLMRILDGQAEVFLRPVAEPGFGGRVEMGASQTDLYDTPMEISAWLDGAGAPVIEIEQSDEGGRFMHGRVAYSIVLTGAPPRARETAFGVWVNLRDFEAAVRAPGVCTNELRTLASLLLSDQFDNACLAF